MLMRCQNCGVEQELPPHLWRKVLYYATTQQGGRYGEIKTVCAACYRWAQEHPDLASVTPQGGKPRSR